jgi:hypothetical protein
MKIVQSWIWPSLFKILQLRWSHTTHNSAPMAMKAQADHEGEKNNLTNSWKLGEKNSSALVRGQPVHK